VGRNNAARIKLRQWQDKEARYGGEFRYINLHGREIV
jgi:hypothetical protein